MAVSQRFSIGLLMAVIVLVAADFAIVRALWGSPGPHVDVAIVTLPMANMLLLATPKMRASSTTRPFWVGFVIVGWPMVLAVAILAWHFSDTFFRPIDWLDK